MTRECIRRERYSEKRHWNRKPSKKNDLVSKFKDLLFKPNTQWYIYVGIAIMGYIFYQFGYSFLYGFYFGRGIQGTSLMDVLINQVPFDFRVVAIIGAVILLFSIVYIVTLIFFVFKDDIRDKIGHLIFHFIVAFIIYYLYSLIGNLGMDKVLDEKMRELLIIGSFIVYCFLFFIKACLIAPYCKFSYTIKIFLAGTFIVVLLTKALKYVTSNNFWAFMAFVFIVGLGLDWLLLGHFNKNKCNNVIKTNKNSVLKNTLLCLGTVVSLIPFFYAGFYIVGSLIGGNSTLNASSTITYYSTEGIAKTENGIVVAQKDNTYYISTKDRNLVVISSPYVTIK